MATESPGHVTVILRRIEAGEQDAVHELMPFVLDQLRSIAECQIRGERNDHTLQATALINEAMIQLMEKEDIRWNDTAHFYRTTALLMRRILVNHARTRNSKKRGGNQKKLPLDEAVSAYEERSVDLVELDQALTRLEEDHPRRAAIVNLRFFGGLGFREIADLVGVSVRTAKSDWQDARVALWRELQHE